MAALGGLDVGLWVPWVPSEGSVSRESPSSTSSGKGKCQVGSYNSKKETGWIGGDGESVIEPWVCKEKGKVEVRAGGDAGG